MRHERNTFGVLALLAFFSASYWQSAHAQLQWETTEQRVTVTPHETQATVSYVFTNAGDYPLSIRSIKVPKGFKAVRPQKSTYRSGESGRIQLVGDIGHRWGKFPYQFTVRTDENDSPDYELKLQLEIAYPLSMKTRRVSWRVGDAIEPKTIDIKVKTSRPIKIFTPLVERRPVAKPDRFVKPHPNNPNRAKSKDSSKQQADGSTRQPKPDPFFKYELKVVEEGRRYQLIITPKSTEQPARSLIKLVSDLPNERGFELAITASVRPKPKPVKPSSEKQESASQQQKLSEPTRQPEAADQP